MAGGKNDKQKWKKHLWCISRYDQPRYATYLGDDWFLIEGPSNFFRYGDDFIDFEGGPFLQIGEFFDMYSDVCAFELCDSKDNYSKVKVKVCNTQPTSTR